MNSAILINKIKDYTELIKLRLTLFVVLSASMAYLWATKSNVDAYTVWLLSIGGFLITGCANILNQLLERYSDKLMKRTQNRPLAAKRMQTGEALLLCIFFGITGLMFLYWINFWCALLGIVAIFTYAFIYTTLKKYTTWVIIPGAIAGSLPVVIGCVASGQASLTEIFLLFFIQFAWQFPHTWSIAWLLNDEYNKAGLKMLPTQNRNNTSAILILFSAFFTIPLGLILYMYGTAGVHIAWLIALAGLLLLMPAYSLFIKQNDKAALRLMFASFLYLPLVFTMLLLDKFL